MGFKVYRAVNKGDDTDVCHHCCEGSGAFNRKSTSCLGGTSIFYTLNPTVNPSIRPSIHPLHAWRFYQAPRVWAD